MESYKVEVKSHLYTHPSETTMNTILVSIPYDYLCLSSHPVSYLPIHFFIHIQKELYKIFSSQK